MASASPSSAPRSTRRAKGITPQQLVPLLPEAVGPWQRVKVETPAHRPGPSTGPVVRSEYRNGDIRAGLSISESGAGAVAVWSGAGFDRETPGGTEKLYKSGARVVREEFRREPQHAAVTYILGNGLIVVASSKATDTTALKELIEGLDLAQAEAIVAPAK